MNIKSNIGFIQGRLVKKVFDRIQAFPLSSWKDEIKIAIDNHFNIMEWTIDYDFFYENPIFKEEDRNYFLEKKDFQIKSITLDFSMHVPFWKCVGSMKNEVIKRHLELIENISATNIEILVLPLVDNGSIENKEQEESLIKGLDIISKSLEKYNKKIAFESDYKPKDLKRLINKFDPNIYGINYDTGNSASLGYLVDDEIESYGNHIINVHIKDRLYKGTTVPLGMGSFDFKFFFNKVKQLDYDGNFILQTARDDSNHIEALNKNRKYIESFI